MKGPMPEVYIHPCVIGWMYQHVGTELFVYLLGIRLLFIQDIRLDRHSKQWEPVALCWVEPSPPLPGAYPPYPHWILFGHRDFTMVNIELARRWRTILRC